MAVYHCSRRRHLVTPLSTQNAAGGDPNDEEGPRPVASLVTGLSLVHGLGAHTPPGKVATAAPSVGKWKWQPRYMWAWCTCVVASSECADT